MVEWELYNVKFSWETSQSSSQEKQRAPCSSDYMAKNVFIFDLRFLEDLRLNVNDKGVFTNEIYFYV